MWRTNANTIEGGQGAHCITTFFFWTGLYDKETVAGRDVLFFGGQSIQSSLTAQDQEAYRDGVPDAGKPTRTSLHFGAPGARHGKVLIDARPGRSRHRVLPALGQSAQPQPRCRRRPGALSDETDTTGQFYSSTAFFSCPTIMCFTAGVFSALHHMWKAWCKQGKKKCWFMVCCRERPAWWGALVDIAIYSCMAV